MKERYKEVYHFKDEHMEEVIYRDLEMPRPFFKIESTYFLGGRENLTEIGYVGYEDIKAMAKEVAEYENTTN